MNKKVDKPALQESELNRAKPEQCKIFVIQGGSDTKFWAQQIADELLKRGYYTTDPLETDVFIVIIGKEFNKALTKDYLNFLSTLLKLDKFVVPVCVNYAKMPDKVPASLSELIKKQALEIISSDSIYRLIIRIVDTFILSNLPAEKTIHPSARNKGTNFKSNLPAKEHYLFICYRRDDSEYITNELSRALVKRIGGHRIFFDLGSQKPGINYINQIDNAIKRSTKFVLVIGHGFFESDSNGIRRINMKGDPVRHEIKTALEMKKKIHVVLTGNASLPQINDLPDDIVGISKVKSISHFNSDDSINDIIEKILSEKPIKPSAKPKGGFLVESMFTKPPYLEYEKKYLRPKRMMAETTISNLSHYGWEIESEQGGSINPLYFLVNKKFPNFRLQVDGYEAEVILQEYPRSKKILGFRRWIPRSSFTITPHDPDLIHLAQLPDLLLEAAQDPKKYLDRVGIHSKKIATFRSESDSILYGNIESMDFSNPSAVESYQKMRGDVYLHGGLKDLVREAQITGIQLDSLTEDLAFHPDGTRLAIASDKGLHLVSTDNWKVYENILLKGRCRSVAFSQQGKMAVGSEFGHIWVWDEYGSEIFSDSPFPLLKRTRARIGEHDNLKFSALSWSECGDKLACFGGDSLWLFNIANQQWQSWLQPTKYYFLSAYGAYFIKSCDELLVFGGGKYLFILKLPELIVRNTIELKQRPFKSLFQTNNPKTEHKEQAIQETYFNSINDAKPNSDGKFAACAGDYGQIAIYNLKSLEQVKVFNWHEPLRRRMPNHVLAISFSPDGRWLASLGDDGKLVVGNTLNWEPEQYATLHSNPLTTRICWSPDSALIAVNAYGLITLWRI